MLKKYSDSIWNGLVVWAATTFGSVLQWDWQTLVLIASFIYTLVLIACSIKKNFFDPPHRHHYEEHKDESNH